MKKAFIIGAGGLAKEVRWLLKDIYGEELDFQGFIDKQEATFPAEMVMSEEDFFKQFPASPEIVLFLGVGNPGLSKNIIKRYSSYEFPNAIHPSFHGDCSRIKMGRGNIITAGVIFTTDIEIGDFNVFNLNSTVGHDCIIGSGNIFNPGCNISGGCKIGSNNLFGTGSTILQYQEIGSDSIIGASSLINRSVPSKSMVFGVPGKIRKEL